MTLETSPEFFPSIGAMGDDKALVSDADIDRYARLTEIEDASYRNRVVIESWEKQQTEERSLRRQYARWLLAGVFLQVLVANVAFFLIGFAVMAVDRWVATSFILGVFGEITGLAWGVMRYLFPTSAVSQFPPSV